MECTEILDRIAAIRDAVNAANPAIIRRLIVEEHLHVQASHRRSLFGWLINKLRRKLLFEVERGLAPVLARQREINLRLLKELEAIRETLAQNDHDQPR